MSWVGVDGRAVPHCAQDGASETLSARQEGQFMGPRAARSGRSRILDQHRERLRAGQAGEVADGDEVLLLLYGRAEGRLGVVDAGVGAVALRVRRVALLAPEVELHVAVVPMNLGLQGAGLGGGDHEPPE